MFPPTWIPEDTDLLATLACVRVRAVMTAAHVKINFISRAFSCVNVSPDLQVHYGPFIFNVVYIGFIHVSN